MKRPILLILMTLLPSVAFATRPGINECSPLPGSKKYISTEFHEYPRNVAFVCTYECNLNEAIHSVYATTKVRINNFDEDATMTTCQGVQVKKVPWGYDFDKVIPFYAPVTNLEELKKWAFDNIEFNPATNLQEKEKLQSLKQQLNQVSSSYIMAGTSGGESTRYFIDAGQKLATIANDLPMSTGHLDEVIQRIIESKGKLESPTTSLGLVETVINSAASWRIPVIK